MPKIRKKNLTKPKTKVYNGEVIIKHCGIVQAVSKDGVVYIKCNQCGQWIQLNKE